MAETFTYDNLIVGGDVVTDGAVLEAGQNLKRGAVLGKVDATGELKLSDDAATDGSQSVYAILNEDCDASGGAKRCAIIIAGEVNANSLIFGGNHTAASTKDAFRDLGIYLKEGE
ncbi:head decoration protein [Nitratiruptor phage NrS-5]|uniref:head decoration protein n=1 Tax=unclassified Nitratiruptor TaxID=2624044 RepID=UPI0019168F8B|nr:MULTISPECIES: head decoration protein [unclassified Nitratiruptor]BCD61745.1 head decoration protein [Nitratiruptor sp. YY08-13]BCD65680.1 head decoration protein [Nitratiruptor sp. YY08-26]BCD83223.1 head decoration protein [Nitratiruptor phage NrS-4]BCD83282.1 head decoration protein [Nitratiruptor phage NrS-5]